MKLTPNQQLVWNYIKSWAKESNKACPYAVIWNALTVQISEGSLNEALKWLDDHEYIRKNIEGNKRTYTQIRNI